MPDVPDGVVTVTSTTPVPGGLSTAIAVTPSITSTTKYLGNVVPNLTADAPVNPVPVIITNVPPPVGPLFGLKPVTSGAAAEVPPASGPAVGLKPVTVVGVIRSSSNSNPRQNPRRIRENLGRRRSPLAGTFNSNGIIDISKSNITIGNSRC